MIFLSRARFLFFLIGSLFSEVIVFTDILASAAPEETVAGSVAVRRHVGRSRLQSRLIREFRAKAEALSKEMNQAYDIRNIDRLAVVVQQARLLAEKMLTPKYRNFTSSDGFNVHFNRIAERAELFVQRIQKN